MAQPFSLSPKVSSTPVNGSAGISIAPPTQQQQPQPAPTQNYPLSVTSASPQTPQSSAPANFNAANFITTARSQGVPDDQIYQYLSNKGLLGASGATQAPAKAPSFISDVGNMIRKGSVGQEITGIAKGIGQTAVGAASLGQNMLQSVGNAITNKIAPAPAVGQKTVANMVGDKLAPKGGWQVAGNVAEQVAELAVPTDYVAAGKDVMKGVGASAKLPELAAEGGKIGKDVSYVAQKVLSAIPESSVGTAWGLLHGQNVKQALGTGAVFGSLSAAGDAWISWKGDITTNINKALGTTGVKSLSDVTSKGPQATRALETMSNMAKDITVKGTDGVEKAWEPTKDGFYEATQALQQTKQKIYDSYTALATQAGDKGAAFTQDNFQSLISDIQKSGSDATSGFKSKAESLIQDIKDNFGTTNKKGITTFADTELGRIQSFLEKINTDVNPMSDNAGATVSATASQSIRGTLDSKIENATGEGYQKLRNSYADLKSIEKPMVNQWKKVAGSTGGSLSTWVQKYGTLDTVLGVLGKSPLETARGAGIAVIGEIMNKIRDPERALRNVFDSISPEAVSSLRNRLIGGDTAATLGKDQYETIISNDAAGAGGDAGAIQPESSAKPTGPQTNGQTGKANSPGGTSASAASTKASQDLESRIQAERDAYHARLKKTTTK
jgi:hypothetical protein